MIDCRVCCNWDVFDHVAYDGVTKQWISTHVETCKIGLSEMDGGRTVSSKVQKCEKYNVATERQLPLC